MSKENGLDSHFLQAANMTDKQLEIFQSELSKSDLPQLPTWESEWTKSAISPLSERIILFKTALISGCYRWADFMRLMTETLQFAGENMNEMTKRHQFDQHPLAKV